jgi:hypothetical protein
MSFFDLRFDQFAWPMTGCGDQRRHIRTSIIRDTPMITNITPDIRNPQYIAGAAKTMKAIPTIFFIRTIALCQAGRLAPQLYRRSLGANAGNAARMTRCNQST